MTGSSPRDDGQLACDISTEKGQGLNSMNDFIREHITRILQPFGEHVDDLRKAVDLLQSDLMETDEKANRSKQQLETHTQKLSVLRTDIDKVTAQAAKTQSSLEETIPEQTRLCADLKKTKEKLNSNCAFTEAIDQKATATETKLSETCDIVSQLVKDLAQTDLHIEEKVEPDIRDLREYLGSLNERHEGTVAHLNDTKEFAEKTDADFQAYVKAYGLQKQKDDRRFAHINASLGDYGSMLKDTDARLQSQVDHLKTTITMVKALRSKLDRKSDELDATTALSRQTADLFESWLPDLEHQRETVRRIAGDIDNQDPNETGNLKDQVMKVHKTISNLREKVDSQDAILEQYQGLINDEGARVVTLDKDLKRLGEHVDKLADRVGVEHVPNAGQQAMQKFVSAVKAHSLTAKAKATSAALDEHASHLDKIDNKILGTVGDLDVTKNMLDKTIEALDLVQRKVDDLSAAQDLTQEYWQGLSKGLRETHKSVALENSLLPPKGFPSVTLPVIPKGESRPLTPGGMRRPRTPSGTTRGSLTAR
jgi:chromosome segregation ATPase